MNVLNLKLLFWVIMQLVSSSPDIRNSQNIIRMFYACISWLTPWQ